jgi:hypothetical protein
MITVTQMPMRNETAGAGTREWLEASRNMIIVAYVGPRAAVPGTEGKEVEPLYATHITETLDAFRYFFRTTIE